MNTEIKKNPSIELESNAAPDVTAATEAEALVRDLAAQKDVHLRLAADFENFKRRSRQEAEARAAAQKESLIVELLPVIDNLERALAASGFSTEISSITVLPSSRYAISFIGTIGTGKRSLILKPSTET